MQKIKPWQILLFAVTLIAGALIQINTIQATRITLGQPLAADGIFVVQAYFPGGYGAFAFDNPGSLEAFVQLPQVQIEPIQPRIKIEEAGL